MVMVIHPKTPFPPETEKIPVDFPLSTIYSKPGSSMISSRSQKAPNRHEIPAKVQQNLFPGAPEGLSALTPI